MILRKALPAQQVIGVNSLGAAASTYVSLMKVICF
jgi:hypothetical protein